MRLKQILKNWKQYSKMADLGEISRRKFFNNAFDGALTCAGIISGFFITFLFDPKSLFTTRNILIMGFATALAIGISGFWGAYLSEEAERKKKVSDMKKEMAIVEEKDVIEVDEDKSKVRKNKKKKIKKTLIERAENFATIVASIVDGGAPVLGSSLPLIPFFFGISLTIIHFIFSYIILVGVLVYLGFFLGKISGGGRVRYALHLVAAGVVTLLVTLLLAQLT